MRSVAAVGHGRGELASSLESLEPSPYNPPEAPWLAVDRELSSLLDDSPRPWRGRRCDALDGAEHHVKCHAICDLREPARSPYVGGGAVSDGS